MVCSMLMVLVMLRLLCFIKVMVVGLSLISCRVLVVFCLMVWL